MFLLFVNILKHFSESGQHALAWLMVATSPAPQAGSKTKEKSGASSIPDASNAYISSSSIKLYVVSVWEVSFVHTSIH
jgi:hypothetical protein